MTTPIAPASLRRRASFVGSTVGMIGIGLLIDMLGVANVPGTATLPADDSDVAFTSFGALVGVLTMAAWVTVCWRRRLPWVVLGAGALLAGIGVSYALLLVGAIAVIRRHPTRMPLVGGSVAAAILLFAVREAVTGWGATLPWMMTRRPDAQFEAGWIAAPFVFAAISLAITAGIVYSAQTRARAQRSDALAAAEQRRADQLNEQMVRQAERENIARDMHDALAHRLSVVSLHAGALEAVEQASGSSQAGEIARTVREQTHAALQDMRGLIGDLRAGPAASGTAPASMRAIGNLVMNLRANGTAVTSFVVIESPERAGALLDSAVFRIVQEAMTNAIKHASGATIDLFVEVHPQRGARVRVVNRIVASGAPVVPGGGNGVLGIRERASALGGTAWVGSHEGDFIVDVTLPWQERE